MEKNVDLKLSSEYLGLVKNEPNSYQKAKLNNPVWFLKQGRSVNYGIYID